MARPVLRLSLLAGLSASLALATTSFAQPAPPPPNPPPGAEPGRHHWDPAQMRAHMAERLKAELQLQPSQQGALEAFLGAMKPPEAMMDRDSREPEAAEHLTTPQRLDERLARMDERRARFVQIAAATKQFYAALSPAQQRAFDALHMGHDLEASDHHRDHGGWGHGPPGEGPHEMGPEGPPHG